MLLQPTQIWLEFPSVTLRHSFSTPSSHWNALLNQSCLEAICAWLQEDYDVSPQPFPNVAALPSYWELLNGTAFEIDDTRFVIVPSEAMDLSEIRVPQEWVDIPAWIADYYLAVQVNLDEQWLRIWGYTTHQQLKQQGDYDRGDRTYSLDETELITDVNVLWVAQELCPDEPTQETVAPLPDLPISQAQSLLERLGNRDVILLRLAVPFAQWGAFLQQSVWRQRLYARRTGQMELWSIRNWLTQSVSELAQQFGWQKIEMQPNLIGARGEESTPTAPILSRPLTIAGQSYELRILQLDGEQNIWRFELRPTSPSGLIPAGFKLELLTENLQPFPNNFDLADVGVEELYVEVALETGEGLVVNLEPLPNDYEQEVLYF
jgi:hypothetical protein